MATDPTSYCIPTGSLIAPIGTIVAIGDTVTGLGIPFGTTVIDVINQGNKLEIVLNQPSWTGSTAPGGITGDGCISAGWFSRITFSKPSITVSFREDVKGWVSFKSFVYESAVSVANDYYTFNDGKLFKHHIEDVDRNTFYGNFTPSSINVILNDGPGTVKSFSTLNYEGSQSKVDVFTNKTTDDFGNVIPLTTDNEYFNLTVKDGWYVEAIETDKEKGSLNEFIEKEGKWFNYLKGKGVITNEFNQILDNEDGSSSFDQDSFAIQGIGTAIAQSVQYTESWDCDGQGNCFDPGNGQGQYSQKSQCDQACIVPSWNCELIYEGDENVYGCVDPGTGNGTFASLSACESFCGENLPCPGGAFELGLIIDADNNKCDNGSVSLGAYNINPSPNWRFEIEDSNGQTVYQSGIRNQSFGTETALNLGVGSYVARVAFMTEPYDSCFDPDWMELPFTIGCTHPTWRPWDCNGVACTQNTHGNGAFNTLAQCQDLCLNNPTYDCIPVGVPGNTTNTCMHNYFGTGTFASQNACQNGCVDAPRASWDCNKQGACVDPGTGNGQYTTLADCLFDCGGGVDPIVIPGCTELDACNYNPLATTDDGSCVPPYGAPAYRVVFGGEINGVVNVGCTQLDPCDVWSSENIPGQLYIGPTSTSNVAQMIYDCNLDNQSTSY
jgi:hypothetical protein